VSRPLPFDVNEYECVRAPVVDAFKYHAIDAETKAAVSVDMTEPFLRKTADTMNAKFDQSGDLCPIVVGHTKPGLPEVDQPPKVGVLHRYSVEDFNGVPALFADHWIKKRVTLALNGVPQQLTAKELVERFPRRSGEIYPGTYEVDPHSLLGATTPHRNLGLLRLSSDGKSAFGYESPGAIKMPEPTDMSKTGDFAKLEAKVDQLAAMLGQVTELLTSALQPQPGHDQHGAGGHEDDMDAFLKSLDAEGGGEGDKGDKKEEKKEPKEPKGEPDGDEKVKLEREMEELKVRLARTEISARLEKMQLAGANVNATDEQLIQDLICSPPDVRERTLVRLQRGAPTLPTRGGPPSGLTVAVARAAGDNGKQITDNSARDAVIKLARQEKILFEQAAKRLGYKLPGQ